MLVAVLLTVTQTKCSLTRKQLHEFIQSNTTKMNELLMHVTAWMSPIDMLSSKEGHRESSRDCLSPALPWILWAVHCHLIHSFLLSFFRVSFYNLQLEP